MAPPARLLLLIGLCAFTACKADFVFRDEFTTDTVGLPPNPDPPGDPVGDRISYTTGFGATEGLHTVVDDAILGSRALRIQNSDGGPPYQRLVFVPIPMTPADPDRFRVSWRGAMEFDRDGSDTFFWVTNRFNDLIAGIEFTQEGELRRQVTPSPGIEWATIGEVTEGKPHSLVWTFDRETRKQQIVLYQESPDDDSLLPALDTGWVDVVDAVPLADEQVFLNQWFWDSRGSDSYYVIDSVRISTKAP